MSVTVLCARSGEGRNAVSAALNAITVICDFMTPPLGLHRLRTVEPAHLWHLMHNVGHSLGHRAARTQPNTTFISRSSSRRSRRACTLCGIPRHTMIHPMTFSTRRAMAALFLAVALSPAGGCVRNYAVSRHSAADLGHHAAAVLWSGPIAPGDLSDLSRWRRCVGPPVVVTSTAPVAASDRLVVVNWNVHVGGGDIARLVEDVRQAEGDTVPIVLLLQEAYRDGPEVPHAIDGAASFASVIRGLRPNGAREEVESVAAALGLHGYYVPSMRNGGPLISAEDRGNAILSTAPLSDLEAIELPFERQRRVAIAANVSGTTTAGAPWRLRVVSAHLDNMSGARRLWIAGSELGRTRQARGLLSALGTHTPLVLGADMNTLFGFKDNAYLETARVFPQTHVTDRRPTFAGMLRLDHLFFRLPEGWSGSFRRADDSYGSDHHPLIGIIDLESR
jgi:endonuclease/exonuclease/phosphatase family metal-dependent hydrolase